MPANGMPTGTIHTMVRLDKVRAGYDGNIVTLVNANADMDNGSVCHVGDLVSGQTQEYQVVQPTSTSILNTPIVLIKSAEFTGPAYYPNTTLKDFYNPQGQPMRGYFLNVGDEFTITTTGISGNAAVDSYLVPTAGSYMLSVVPNLSGNTRFAAVITNANAYFGYTGSGLTQQAAVTARVVQA